MWKDLPLFPEAASANATQVDLLYLYLILVSAFFAIVICAVMLFFAIKYRRNERNIAIQQIDGNTKLEIVWSVLPMFLLVSMFAWGALLYFHGVRAPKDCMDIYVVGKQWMWKIQHPTGQREINDLHIPIGKPIRLTLTSEDVIHSYYIPAMRFKRDVVPGRYTQIWFTPTKLGTYHIFCAEYCGKGHSTMGGWCTVLSEADYQKWLSGSTGAETAEEAGKQLFEGNRCETCHKVGPDARGPLLSGVFGSKVALKDGGSVLANEEYVRESILHPLAKVVAGFEPVMPTYEGQLTEEQIMQLIAYIKSIKGDGPKPADASKPADAQKPADAPKPKDSK